MTLKALNPAGNMTVSIGLKKLGQDIQLARRRRKISAEVFCERIGCTRPTLKKLEEGDPFVSMKTWARALFVLGKFDELSNLMDFTNDITGQVIANASLVKKKPRVKKHDAE